MPGPAWPRLLILCSALALHNIQRIGPVTLVDELRARYGTDYTGIGNVIGAYTLAYGMAQLGAGLLTLALLSGCADGPSLPKISDLNPFKEKQVPLPGKRMANVAQTRVNW